MAVAGRNLLTKIAPGRGILNFRLCQRHRGKRAVGTRPFLPLPLAEAATAWLPLYYVLDGVGLAVPTLSAEFPDVLVCSPAAPT
mmetsp:Transcript_10103/g.15332  ORF Transcript_10103/g.15332 Transcript_10103/m.15332 type:complete len:84 (+) Transcript_10103:3054-3305(+)